MVKQLEVVTAAGSYFAFRRGRNPHLAQKLFQSESREYPLSCNASPESNTKCDLIPLSSGSSGSSKQLFDNLNLFSFDGWEESCVTFHPNPPPPFAVVWTTAGTIISNAWMAAQVGEINRRAL